MNKKLLKIKETIAKKINLYFFPVMVAAGISYFTSNNLLPYISEKFQLPIPEIVSSEDYGAYAIENSKKLGVVMNTRPKVEINQNSSGLEIELIDGDGFYPAGGWSNPHLEIYGISPAGFPRKVVVRTTFLSETTDRVKYLDIKLPPGDYVLGIYYHENSGIFRAINREIKIDL